MRRPYYKKRCSDCRQLLNRDEVIDAMRLCFSCQEIRLENAEAEISSAGAVGGALEPEEYSDEPQGPYGKVP